MSKKDSDENENRTTGSEDNALPKNRKNFDKRLFLLLLLLPLGYAVWKFIPKGDKQGQNTKDVVEETLYAKNPLLQLLEPDETGIDFQNRIDETIDNNYATNINVYNGGGVTIGDMNNDNLPDIYFVRSNGQNCLYINQGDFKFKDITQSAGLSSEEGFETSAAAIDINADGFLDLYVCRAGPFFNETRRNKLYINNGLSPLWRGKGGGPRGRSLGVAGVGHSPNVLLNMASTISAPLPGLLSLTATATATLICTLSTIQKTIITVLKSLHLLLKMASLLPILAQKTLTTPTDIIEMMSTRPKLAAEAKNSRMSARKLAFGTVVLD